MRQKHPCGDCKYARIAFGYPFCRKWLVYMFEPCDAYIKKKRRIYFGKRK